MEIADENTLAIIPCPDASNKVLLVSDSIGYSFSPSERTRKAVELVKNGKRVHAKEGEILTNVEVSTKLQKGRSQDNQERKIIKEIPQGFGLFGECY